MGSILHWLGGFMWHYIERANRENFLYDLHCIDGESMQYTQYGPGQFYGWHNDSGLACHYKPASVGNRMEGRAQDFVNENTELVRKLSLYFNFLILMIMKVAIFNCLMREVSHTLLPESVVV